MAQEKGAGGIDQGGRIWKAWEVQHHGLLMDCWGTGGGRKDDGVEGGGRTGCGYSGPD